MLVDECRDMNLLCKLFGHKFGPTNFCDAKFIDCLPWEIYVIKPRNAIAYRVCLRCGIVEFLTTHGIERIHLNASKKNVKTERWI